MGEYPIQKYVIYTICKLLCIRVTRFMFYVYSFEQPYISVTLYLQAPRVQFEQNQKLCLDLMKKGPQAFEKFVVCLFKSNLELIGERLLVCEHNYRHRANVSNFQQLPDNTKTKYRAPTSIRSFLI